MMMMKAIFGSGNKPGIGERKFPAIWWWWWKWKFLYGKFSCLSFCLFVCLVVYTMLLIPVLFSFFNCFISWLFFLANVIIIWMKIFFQKKISNKQNKTKAKTIRIWSIFGQTSCSKPSSIVLTWMLISKFVLVFVLFVPWWWHIWNNLVPELENFSQIIFDLKMIYVEM